MSEALERLSKIVDVDSFCDWYDEFKGYKSIISDIQEVVALAKKNQQPSIDTMRFEAAKTAKTAMSSLIVKYPEDFEVDTTHHACIYSDKLIAELQKTKL